MTFDDYDALSAFVLDLAERGGGTDRFRGTEVRCERSMTGHRWTTYGPRTRAFTSDIGPDETDYVIGRLAQSVLAGEGESDEC